MEVIGKPTRASDLIGEIGVLSPKRCRTVSAVAASDRAVYALSAAAVQVLCYQNPQFGYALPGLALLRLTSNSAQTASR